MRAKAVPSPAMNPRKRERKNQRRSQNQFRSGRGRTHKAKRPRKHGARPKKAGGSSKRAALKKLKEVLRKVAPLPSYGWQPPSSTPRERRLSPLPPPHLPPLLRHRPRQTRPCGDDVAHAGACCIATAWWCGLTPARPVPGGARDSRLSKRAAPGAARHVWTAGVRSARARASAAAASSRANGAASPWPHQHGRSPRGRRRPDVSSALPGQPSSSGSGGWYSGRRRSRHARAWRARGGRSLQQTGTTSTART